MKVYILLYYWDYENSASTSGSEIRGVYTTLEKAQAAKKEEDEKPPVPGRYIPYAEGYSVEEHPVL